MSFSLRKVVKKTVMNVIAPSMRSPSGGITGWFARRLMSKYNPISTAFGIKRLNLKSEDVFVEIGAGNGAGLKAIMMGEKATIPSRIVLVEISEDFRQELNRIVSNELPPSSENTKNANIEIYGNDCKNMSSFLENDSVDKIFAMNVIYFLNPLEEYMNELLRVLKPGGTVVFGCKFKSVPQNNDIFVNTDQDEIVKIMENTGGFASPISIDSVEISDDEPMKNYIEIRGTKKK